MLEKAIELLVLIQESLQKFEAHKNLPLECFTCGPNFSQELQERYEKHILPMLENISEHIKEPESLNLLRTVSLTKMVRTLKTSEDDSVLIRWDYKPDNLLLGKNGIIYPIDWTRVMKGSRWIDLAFLIGDLSEEDRHYCLNYYLKVAKRAGGYEKSKIRLESALKLIQLIHISANCKLLSIDEKNQNNYVKNINRHLELFQSY